MASWEDGPEYAPTQRPDAFVTPDAAPLVPEPAVAVGPDAAASVAVLAPLAPPAYQPPDGAVPLDSVAPPRPNQRDPLAAFELVATPLTTARPLGATASDTAAVGGATASSALASPPPVPDGSPFPAPVGPPVLPASTAWDGAHSAHTGPRPKLPWAPEQPFQPPAAPPMSLPAPQQTWPAPQVNPASFPPPQHPGWYPPSPPNHQGPGPLPPVTFSQMWRAASTGVMVSLLIGGLIAPVAATLLMVATVLTGRVAYRRARVQRTMGLALAAAFALGGLSALVLSSTTDILAIWDASNTVAQWLNWGLAIYVLLTQGDALRRNEPPEFRP